MAGHYIVLKKLIFPAPGKASLVEVEAPSLHPGLMLLRTHFSGLSNGTERNQLLGLNYNSDKVFPFLRPGYQTVSRVVSTGGKITKFKPGDWVATGTFGTHQELHCAEEDDLVTRLPDGFDLIAGALLSIAGVAYRTVYRAETNADDKVLICGAGPIALLSLQIARLRGAAVFVLTRSGRNKRLLERFGAQASGWGDALEQDKFLEAHAPFDVVIESTGSNELMQKIIGCNWGQGVIKRRGRMVVLAGFGEVHYSGNAAQGAELALLHSAHFSPEDHQAVIDLVHTGALAMQPLVREVVPVNKIEQVYATLRDTPSKLGGTVFDWTGLGPRSRQEGSSPVPST